MLPAAILPEVADNCAVQRHQRQWGVGDFIPLAPEGADDVQREPECIQYDRSTKIVEVLQCVRDQFGDDNAAFELVHSCSVEIGDDRALAGEIGFGQESPQFIVNLVANRQVLRPPSRKPTFHAVMPGRQIGCLDWAMAGRSKGDRDTIQRNGCRCFAIQPR